MSRTTIPFGSATAQKAWSALLFTETVKKQYFTKFTGANENSIIQRLTDLETDAGDRISFDLSVELRGRPTKGDDRLEGREEQLKFFTDEVIIDQLRKAVSAGGKMTRKRTSHNLRKVAKTRLSDYWSQYCDELMFIYLSGSRGTNEDFIESTDFSGHAGNDLQAPDAQHIMFGGAATSKATITTDDVMTRSLIERVSTHARMMRARDPKTANLVPIAIGSEKHYVLLMSPYQEHNLRTNEGNNGWLEIQKAAAAAEGRKNPIFSGGLGMINKIVLHSHESAIRFRDYGAGSNVPAARALFMGAQAGVVAYGNGGGGLRFNWEEDIKDYKNEPTVAAGTILGVKKTRFNNRDFGVVALDTAAVPTE